MKVKKRKEQWFAVKWDGGSSIPPELSRIFDHIEVQDWSDYALIVSRYKSSNEWQEVEIRTGMWAVFSDRRKIKEVFESDFWERWEEDE